MKHTTMPPALAEFIARGRAAVTISGAEPVYLPRGEDAFLVLHGWCATAESVRYLTAGVAAAGFSALAPTLPGHGTNPADMTRFGPLDWVAAGLEALCLLCDYHRSVHLLGTSMGGTLALLLAAAAPDLIASVTTVNAPIFLANPAMVVDILKGKASDPLPGWTETAFKGPSVPEITYSERSHKSGADLMTMCTLARTALPRVTASLQVLHSVQDQIVPTDCAPEITARCASTFKSLIWLERSFHAAQLDLDRDLIVSLAVTMARQGGIIA